MVASEYTLFLGCIATHSTLTCLLLASNFVNHIMDSPDTLKTSKAFKKKSPRRRNRGNSLQLPKGVRVRLFIFFTFLKKKEVEYIVCVYLK